MSAIYIKDYDETVFDWEIKKKSEIEKIKSNNTKKLRRKIIQSKQENKNKLKTNQTRSWGYFETPIRKPCNYLKKGEGIRFKKAESEHHICLSSERRPPVPTLKNADQEFFQKKVVKNFKLENIKTITNKVPKEPKPKYIDTRKGDAYELHKSGMIPEYMCNQNFGKIPSYLSKIKSHFRKEYNKSEQQKSSDDFNLDNNLQTKLNLRRVDSSERLDILNGLKKNWNDLQQEYQKLSVITDTEHKKQRKTRIENELKKFEKDILMIENNPIICVCDE